MSSRTFLLFREPTNLGKVYFGGRLLCHTREDEPTLPFGKYKLTLSFSHKFDEHLPLIHAGPQAPDAWIYGGDLVPNTKGSIFVGRIRTIAGVQKCPDTIRQIISLVQDVEDSGDTPLLEIR